MRYITLRKSKLNVNSRDLIQLRADKASRSSHLPTHEVKFCAR
ncbi:hypothetical protein ATN83_4760 [Raoultella ornithinolytica]|nr:hypothetical protein ATN83_4760 [Raoultella ornithinolytica]KDV89417.1 hypothetical protein AB00_5418 [Raoultella ornithinolytica 2-156-04_S1_C1]KDX08925.1 hypothetical protein AB28_5409 [Raoultella ornithinolytica 2-156-04_S1_C2]